MKSFFQHVKAFPHFLFLFPLFAVLHALVENFHPVLIPDAVEILLLYSLSTLLLYVVLWLFYRNVQKTVIGTVLVSSLYYFFAPFHDLIKSILHDFFFTKYIFLIPFLLVTLFALLVFLKRSSKSFDKTSNYLKLLFVIFISIDSLMLVREMKKERAFIQPTTSGFYQCDSCLKPDVYFIIADEYAGKKELEDIFSFGNDSFENSLQERGFYLVPNPTSNYNATVYSMASLLNMDYIKGLSSPKVTHKTMIACESLINNNRVAAFFQRRGYKFYNCSFFRFIGLPQAAINSFYHSPKSLLTVSTLTSKLWRDIWFNFASKKQLDHVKRNVLFMNEKLEDAFSKAAEQKTTQPKFVYTHLCLPHHPFYFYGNGNPVPADSINDDRSVNKRAYLEYLKYANKKYLAFIDHILQNASRPPVIILMSDHGFRQFTDNTDHSYYFKILNAVLLPNKNYSGFYSGMSSVNQFRLILNNQFGQHLPLLKDSTTFFRE
jgi:hypothetical protein